MENYINVANFNVNELEGGKLYTLYYELSDEELNNKNMLGQIINSLWDNFMINPSLDSNIKLDRENKLITIDTKLKDNLIYQTATNTLKSYVNILGQAVTNIVKNIINKEPIAVTVSPLIVKTATDTAQTITQTTAPIVATVVNSAGEIVNTVNDTFKNTKKITPYIPYIIVGVGVIIALSYANLGNIKKLFTR
jgi:hypothetical protein